MIAWSYNKQLVPGHPGWYFQIGLGGPCWFVNSLEDSYTGIQVDRSGDVTARNVPRELVRWLLDNCPPLDSWVKPTQEQVQASWDSRAELTG